MTASLSAPYALPGESSPSQPAHQKGLPPAPPHGVVEAVQVPKATVSVVKAPKPVVPAKPVVTAPQTVKLADLPSVPVEPVQTPVVKLKDLPDVPAMGN
jgi:hypothetical protein